MHILVTDRLACAICGPRFGLVLVASELRDRRVLSGFLGCSNCRERYPIDGGFGDLRPPPRPSAPPTGRAAAPPPERALELAALLGVREGPGLVLLTGSSVASAAAIAGIVQGIEVLATHPSLRADPEVEGVSRVAVGEPLPFHDGCLRGAVLEGPGGLPLLPEAARVLAPGARVVLLDPPEGATGALAAADLQVVMEAESALVGARKGR